MVGGELVEARKQRKITPDEYAALNNTMSNGFRDWAALRSTGDNGEPAHFARETSAVATGRNAATRSGSASTPTAASL